MNHSHDPQAHTERRHEGEDPSAGRHHHSPQEGEKGEMEMGGKMEHEGHHDHHAHMVKDFRRRFFICLAVTLPVLLLSPMLQEWLGIAGALSFPGDHWVLLALSTFVYGFGGWPFLRGMVGELKDKRPGMMTLVAMAISVAFFYSVAVVLGLSGKIFFWETVTLIDLMLFGHWIEMRSVLGAGRALEELVRLMPTEAHKLGNEGMTEEVPVSELRSGDRVLIRPGERVPADGKVLEGKSSMNESMLTGESRPVEKTEGMNVVAGGINGTGSLVVEVTKTGEESYLSQVIGLVREAQSSKSRTQDLANRAAFFLTVTALSVGIITFVVWNVVVGESLSFSIERMVTVMVIACPHALGLAIPLVVAVSTGISARNGLLIRDRVAFERARLLDTLVFDKTGTLTEGEFGVTDILRFDTAIEEDELLRLAAAVENGSEHPIAQGIVKTARERGVTIPPADGFQSITGRGVRGDVEGKEVKILSPGGIEEEMNVLPEREGVEKLGRQGKTVVFLVLDGKPVGAFALADVIREESKTAVRRLHEMGISVVMLTGDKREVAEWVAGEIGLDKVFAEVLPDQKSANIAELQKGGKIVAMTGDGVNDAPALAKADVGIAVGAGTDVAVETADIVLVRSDPRDVVAVIGLSRATYGKMVQNLWYAAGYNIIAIPLAAGVLAGAGIILSPAVGAVLMSLSTVVVAINARLLRFGGGT